MKEDIAEDLASFGSVTNSNGDSCQELWRRLRLGRAAIEKLGKVSIRDQGYLHPGIPNYCARM